MDDPTGLRALTERFALGCWVQTPTLHRTLAAGREMAWVFEVDLIGRRLWDGPRVDHVIEHVWRDGRVSVTVRSRTAAYSAEPGEFRRGRERVLSTDGFREFFNGPAPSSEPEPGTFDGLRDRIMGRPVPTPPAMTEADVFDVFERALEHRR